MNTLELPTSYDQTELMWIDEEGVIYTAKEAQEMDDLSMEIWKDSLQ